MRENFKRERMNYFNQFQKHISNNDYSSFLTLWEEYCMGDEIEGAELKKTLETVKDSGLAVPFGRHVEQIIPLWDLLEESDTKHNIFKYIIDLQTTNTPDIANLTFDYLKKKYGDHPNFNVFIKLIGLRELDTFQGAVSDCELLVHMQPKKFVFHTGGWGTGEIMEVSLLREQLTLEFDYVAGRKDLSFKNAFKTLIPLPDDHFLALRFGNPDVLEDRAKKDPLLVMHTLLRDLGPLTAADIKEELCELVIPEEDWARWWQNTRAKIKKDTLIESPSNLKTPFKLRDSEVTHESKLQKALETKPDANTLIQMVYTFLRDFPTALKNIEFKNFLVEKLKEALSTHELTDAQALEIHFFLEDLSGEKDYAPVTELIKRFSSVEDVACGLSIVAFKKRMLLNVRKVREDWASSYLNLILSIDQNPLRDTLFRELIKQNKKEEVEKKLEELIAYPSRYPHAFLWYIQKIMKDSGIPFSDQEGKNRFFESFLILLSILEQSSTSRDLIKKIHNFLINGRYANVRKIIQNASEEVVQEFLLLATKCHSLSDHDIKIFHSLAEVVHPSLGKLRKKYEGEEKSQEDDIIWSTEEGYRKVKERIHQIATVETVENAREIEVARSHGDLRENAEFKTALEKRDRLQGELKHLSDMFGNARILNETEVDTSKIGVGVVIDLVDDSGKTISYTLLGPWEADPDKNIISFQSKLSQEMTGKKKGEKVKIQGVDYTVSEIRNFFKTKV